MKLSLITPTYNSAKTIRDTLNSVNHQSKIDLEYIIVDGNSTDQTLKIIKEYQNNLPLTIISEPDNGLYDAMNKGISRATGDIVGIINSDDFYQNNTALQKIINIFITHPDIDIVYGDLEFVDSLNIKKVIRFWRAGEYKEKKLANGWTMPHPTMFVRKQVYEKYGTFNPNFHLAGDYELTLRLLKKDKVNVFYYHETLVAMRAGGRSGKNLKNRQAGWRELKLA
jgi:glycosyltransferase